MNKLLTLNSVSVALLAFFSSASTFAQSDTVVVSGSRTETKLSETPVSIGSVNRSQWDQDKVKSVVTKFAPIIGEDFVKQFYAEIDKARSAK